MNLFEKQLHAVMCSRGMPRCQGSCAPAVAWPSTTAADLYKAEFDVSVSTQVLLIWRTNYYSCVNSACVCRIAYEGTASEHDPDKTAMVEFTSYGKRPAEYYDALNDLYCIADVLWHYFSNCVQRLHCNMSSSWMKVEDMLGHTTNAITYMNVCVGRWHASGALESSHAARSLNSETQGPPCLFKHDCCMVHATHACPSATRSLQP
jgi:hypothetical protein